MLISNVIRYNANDNPSKQTAFSQYDRPQAKCRYGDIADHLGLTASGDDNDAKVEKLVAWIESVKKSLEIPAGFKDLGITEEQFMAKLDEVAVEAFDDQCTGANPRYPLIDEIKQLLLDGYYGRVYVEGRAEDVVDLAEEKAKKASKAKA